MQGLQIFLHSVRMVFNNLGPALRISGALTLLQFALIFVLGVQVIFSEDGGQALMLDGTYPTGRVALYALISVIIGLWIAVAWHRYVLREEDSGGVIPTWNGGRIWAYFVKGLLVFLTTLAVAAVVGLVAGIISGLALSSAAANSQNALAVGVILSILIGGTSIYVFYRLSPAMPAAALGEPLGLRESWGKMTGKGGTIFVLALVSIVVSLALSMGPIYLLGLTGLLAVIWGGLMQWFSTMVGISIMTTLYGHYIEGRTLD